MKSESSSGNAETRQAKRAAKLRKKRQKVKQHGKGLAQMYRDAVEKRERK